MVRIEDLMAAVDAQAAVSAPPAAPSETIPGALSPEQAFAKAIADAKGLLAGFDGALQALYYHQTGQAQAMTHYLDGFGGVVEAIGGAGYLSVEFAAEDGAGDVLLSKLEALGLQNGVSYGPLVAGLLPVDAVTGLLDLEHLAYARKVYAETDTGTVTTQADAVHRADIARSTYGFTGAGVKVGIMSDSYDNLNGAAAGMSTGNLPTVQIIDELASGGTDEGRAMAELVHDLAPGASLAFAEAVSGLAAFATNIRALAAAGARVIVDDIYYSGELAYQDSILAQAIDEFTASGGVYFSSGGNRGHEGWQGAFVNGGAAPAPFQGGYDLMQFAPGQNYLTWTVNSGSSARLTLHWDSPGIDSGGLGAYSDLDLFILNAAGTTFLTSSTTANIGGNPVESVVRGPGTYRVYVGVYLPTTPADRMPTNIRVLSSLPLSGNDLQTTATNTNEGTPHGHSQARSNISSGASSFAQGNVNPAAEVFSTRGVVPIFFDPAGNRLATPEIRTGSEVTGVDGGNTSFFGSDSTADSDTLPNFFGTSAAAPDLAAIAALMLQARPGLNAYDIRHLMQASAVDMDDSLTPGFDVGFDQKTGAGLVLADKAVLFASTLNISNPGQKTLVGTHFNDTITGSSTADFLYGGDGFDTVRGGAGGDLVEGNAGNDGLFGEADNDTVRGGEGDDYIYGGAGADSLFGDGGSDTAAFGDLGAPVTATLIAGQAVVATSGGVQDALTSIENLAGSEYDDIFTGDVNANVLTGGGGADRLDGGAGDDTIIGGLGDDLLFGGAGIDTAVFTAALSQVSIRFRGNSIVVVSNEGTDTLVGFERFSFNGRIIDRDAADGVDDLYYLSTNLDVAANGIDADAHFNGGGQGEGRNPNPFFNRAYYLANNPDLPNTPTFDALGHYLTTGWTENRNPSASFDTSDYLQANRDVVLAGINPLLHFITSGGDEGRQRYVLFDDGFYLANNPDIAAAGIDPYAHWLAGGRAELRDPHPLFDADGYRATYPDIGSADPLTHYLTVGWTQGRDPSQRFDTSDYLGAYPDVAAAGVNPLLHYLVTGRAEGRLYSDDGVWG